MRKIKLITGPCSAETSEQVFGTASLIASTRSSYESAGFELVGFRAGVWKPRTRPGNFEGAGEDALQWVSDAGKIAGVPAMVEVSTPDHVEAALKAGIEMVWIGARTATNPFDVQQIADSLRGVDILVFVKNPINPDTDLWIGAIERVGNAGVRSVSAIHRGFSFYEKNKYRNYPKWQVPIDLKRRMPEVELFCDPSHIGGRSEYISELSQKALDLGFDGLFVESHFNPACAMSDAAQQVTPAALASILSSLVIRETGTVNYSDGSRLDMLRSRIDDIDENILDLLAERMNTVDEIGSLKRANNITVLQKDRWNQVLDAVTEGAKERALDERFIQELFKLIHQESIDRQS